MEARINGVNKVTIASASFTNYYDKTEIDELYGAKQLLYLTQEEYNNLSDEERLNDNVVFNIIDAVTEYPTIEQVNELVSNKADAHHIHNDYLTAIPDEYITNEELEAKNYVTEAVFNAAIGDIDSILDFINGEII